MAQLMLINPAKRPSKRRGKATAAQLRALKKARAARKVSSNPAPRRRRASLRAASAPRRMKRARRNPIGMSGIFGDVMGAVQGAGGALAINAAFNLLPLPATIKAAPSGMAGTAVKMGMAVALGMVGRKVLGRAAGKMAEGAMTVAAYDAIKGFVPSTFGGDAPAGVAGLGYYGPAVNAGALPEVYPNTSVMDGMGEYVSGMGQYTY